jgi:hypothetical protein
MLVSIDWITLHQKLGFIVVVASIAGALVAIISLVTPLIGVILKIYLRVLLLVVAVQIVLGAVLYFMGDRPKVELHYLYGAGVAVTLGVTSAVSRRTPWPLSKLPLVAGAIIATIFAVLAVISG